ncbi:MAG: hypothetical protein ACRDJH_26465 [Thermomicrobiales bacterium]
MSRVVDLGSATERLPTQLVGDSNLVIAHLLVAYHTPYPIVSARTGRFFRRLRVDAADGLITTTAWTEISHFVIRQVYRQLVPQHQDELSRALPGKRRHDWRDLYKTRPDLMSVILPELRGLRRTMSLSNLVFLQPDDLGAIPAGLPIEVALEETIGRYHLDSNDAAILLEARRAGLTSIATLDADLGRAAPDFDVYT